MEIRTLFALFIIFFMAACSSLDQIALTTSSRLLFKASKEVETEGSYKNFSKSVAGQMKLVEGLLFADPTNQQFLLGAMKARGAMAYLVNEVKYLEDKLMSRSDSEHLKEAIVNYSKGMEYALRWLKLNDIAVIDLVKAAKENEGISRLLSSKLPNNTFIQESIFAIAQIWGGLINLRRQDIVIIGQLGIVKGLFDWVCQLDPDLYYGSCDLFNATYYAGRSKTLGGDPQRGEKIFNELFKKRPGNLLARVTYLEFMVIPRGDTKLFQEQANFLNEAARDFEKSLIYRPVKKSTMFDNVPDSARLFNAVALEKWKIINRNKKLIF